MSDDEIERELEQMVRVMLTTGGQGMEMLARNRQQRAQRKIEEERRTIDAAERAGRAQDQAQRDQQR